jgi:anti-anti-sigma factor
VTACNSRFEIQEVRESGWARLTVSGELDLLTALTFRRRLRALKATDTHVRVDLSQLEFIDSAGARALDDAIAESRQGTWRVELAPSISDPARRFFALTEAAGLRVNL